MLTNICRAKNGDLSWTELRMRNQLRNRQDVIAFIGDM